MSPRLWGSEETAKAVKAPGPDELPGRREYGKETA
jgi:hypothetical protein